MSDHSVYRHLYHSHVCFPDRHIARPQTNLCYIVGVESQAFYGVNLHYTLPKNRLPVLRFIDDGGDFSKLNGYNKYLKSYVRGTFTSLVGSDMEKAIEMRLEDFVRNLGGISVDIDPKLKSFYRR